MIFKQLQEIYRQDASISYCNEKKLQKCLSATDITSIKQKNSQKNQDIFQISNLQLKQRNQKSAELSQFMFCIKLKMISMISLFESSEFNSQKIQYKDPKQILNQLTRLIKNYIKDSTRRLNESENKNKSLEIKSINLESSIKTLQSGQEYLKKQIQRAAKVHAVDIKKLQNKFKQKQRQKQTIETKSRTLQQITDQQIKILTQQQMKINDLTKDNKQLESVVFQKEKNILNLINNHKFLQTKKNQQCEGLKNSFIKKVQELNKTNLQIKKLQQIIENKQQIIEEMRRNYNNLYAKYQKSQEKINKLGKQKSQFQAEMIKKYEQYEIKFKTFIQKQRTINQSLKKIQDNFQKKQNIFQQLTQQIKNILAKQYEQYNYVNQIETKVSHSFSQLQNNFNAELMLQQKQFQSIMKEEILNSGRNYREKIQRLENQIQKLKFSSKNQ